MNDIKLPFGLQESTNKIVHVSDVVRGKRCDCVCPSCRITLIAAKGEKLQHHFRHYNGDECKDALEKSIYLAAKQVIMEQKQLRLPEYVYTASKIDSKGKAHSITKIRRAKRINFDLVQEDITLHGMKVDILAKKNETPLIIYIFYGHTVEDEKLLKILKANNISAIGINLPHLTWRDRHDWESFYSCINNPNNIKWLNNIKDSKEIQKRLEEELDAHIFEGRSLTLY